MAVERVVKAVWKEVLQIDLPEFPHITYDYAMSKVWYDMICIAGSCV